MSTIETPKEMLIPVPDDPPPTRWYALIAVAAAIVGVVITLVDPHLLAYVFGCIVLPFYAYVEVEKERPSEYERAWTELEAFARSNDFALIFPHGFVYDPSEAKLYAHDYLREVAAGPYKFCRLKSVAGRNYIVIKR